MEPLGERNGHISDQTLGISLLYDPIADLDLDRLTAIQAGGIDLNRFPRKKPADRQRLKRSLAKPFLLTVDSNSELRGEIVKRCERSDEIRIGKKPPRDSR